MKKMIRKVTSIIAAFIMVISMVGSYEIGALASSADTGELSGQDTTGTTITEIKLTVEEPLVGATDTTVKFSYPEDANYTVEAVSDWLVGNSDEAGMIEYNSAYGARFYVKPNDGYTIADDATVTVNGDTEGVNFIGVVKDDSDGRKGQGRFDFVCESSVLGTIDSVSLTGVTEYAEGSPATPYSVEDTYYSATSYWFKYNYDTKSWGEPLDASHSFEAGGLYRQEIQIDCKLGYILREDAEFKVNGNEKYFENYYSSAQSVVDILMAEEITTIYLKESYIPMPVIGAGYDEAGVELAIPDTENYTATGRWRDIDYNEAGTFEDGEIYYLDIIIRPKEGYYLSEDLGVYIGEEDAYAYAQPEEGIVEYKYSFAEEIDKVELINVPKAAVGEAIQKGQDGTNEFSIDVPADANYTAVALWRLSESGSNADGNFEAGKSYDLYIMLATNEGYEFTEDLVVVMDGISYAPDDSDADWANVHKIYSFCQVIDTIEINGVKEPVLGETPAVDTLKVPEGANYTIRDASWLDVNSGEEATRFEAGHAYHLNVDLVPKDGYEFGVYPKFFVDGEDCSNNGNAESYWANITACVVSYKEVITEVRVNDVPEMKVGEKATAENISVPENANYEISYASWAVWSETKKEYVEFDGVFEAGKSYELKIDVCPKDGYSFDYKTTAVYINEALDTSVEVSSDRFTISKYYSEGVKVIDRVELTIDEPIIGTHSSIKPVITAPEGVGYEVASESYKSSWLLESIYNFGYYGYFEDGKNYGVMYTIRAKEGYVFADEVVMVINGKIIADEDMYLSYKDKSIQAAYFFDSECSHAYGDWTDAKDGTHVRSCIACGHKVTENHVYTDDKDTSCNDCGYVVAKDEGTADTPKDDTADSTEGTTGTTGTTEGAAANTVPEDGSPATGDNSNMMSVFMLMLICGAGMLMLGETKRRNNK